MAHRLALEMDLASLGRELGKRSEQETVPSMVAVSLAEGLW